MTGTLHGGQYAYLIIFCSFLPGMGNISDRLCRECQNKNSCFKSYCLWFNVEKYCGSRQATDDKMAHVHCRLDTYGYKHTLTICT